jgi:hypothetical protein
VLDRISTIAEPLLFGTAIPVPATIRCALRELMGGIAGRWSGIRGMSLRMMPSECAAGASNSYRSQERPLRHEGYKVQPLG